MGEAYRGTSARAAASEAAGTQVGVRNATTMPSYVELCPYFRDDVTDPERSLNRNPIVLCCVNESSASRYDELNLYRTIVAAIYCVTDIILIAN